MINTPCCECNAILICDLFSRKAVIEFETIADATAALEKMHRQQLDGIKISIKYDRINTQMSRTVRDNGNKSGSSVTKTNILRVRNLHPSTTNESLLEAFGTATDAVFVDSTR